jgi:hypothetical protein
VPLAFESLSHGTIAFGFFNIESDMLLLDRYFLFAEDFCGYIKNMAKNAGDGPYHIRWKIQFIEAAEDIGDLMGAIHGVRFTGFFGELYRRFPFPRQDEDFKQKPEGFQTQSLVLETISNYAKPLEITVAVSTDKSAIEIGDYRFNRAQFQALLKYVWRGGFPRWKDEIRPVYVIAMMDAILQNLKGIFNGINFEVTSREF